LLSFLFSGKFQAFVIAS